MSLHSVPAFRDLIGVFADYGTAVEFLFQARIIARAWVCDCGNELDFQAHRMGFRCGLKVCRKEFSVFKGTLFFKKKLGPHEILHIAHLWLSGADVKTISTHLRHDGDTISYHMRLLRNLVRDSLTMHDQMVGGEGVVVEVDETKLGKRKHNRGHPVEGVWVLGGVERTESRKIFLVPVPDRSSETLLGVLSRHLLPGTIVHSDMWRGYIQLGNRLDVGHRTVNHSLHFVDPVTQVHTNTIEGTWSALKNFIPIRRRTRECVEGHLFEFIWRRIHVHSLWESLLEAMRSVYCE